MLSDDIVSLLGLADFEKEKIETSATNLRKPKGDRTRHPDQDYVDEFMTIPKPGLTFGINSQQQMLVASELMRFYVTINRNLTVDKFRWNTTITKFKYQWVALEKKANVTANPPKTTKNFSIMKWSEAISNHLSLMIGLRMLALSYVVCEKV